jgi:hypothetical protein
MTRPLAALALLAALPVAAARADFSPPPSVPLRAAAAAAVVVGKVTAVTEKAEKAELYKGDERDMKIATVRADRVLLGNPGRPVKVAFLSAPASPLVRRPHVRLAKGQEALLFLDKHPTKKGVYLVLEGHEVVARKGNPDFKKQVEQVKPAVALMANPLTSLKAKKASDRLLAAALLITRYKTAERGNGTTEPVPAAESKLILTILAEADWTIRDPDFDWAMAPPNLFFRLRLTEKDGWKRPLDFQKITPAAKKWLKDNAGKYKMTRFVRDKIAVTADPEP